MGCFSGSHLRKSPVHDLKWVWGLRARNSRSQTGRAWCRGELQAQGSRPLGPAESLWGCGAVGSECSPPMGGRRAGALCSRPKCGFLEMWVPFLPDLPHPRASRTTHPHPTPASLSSAWPGSAHRSARLRSAQSVADETLSKNLSVSFPCVSMLHLLPARLPDHPLAGGGEGTSRPGIYGDKL